MFLNNTTESKQLLNLANIRMKETYREFLILSLKVKNQTPHNAHCNNSMEVRLKS